MTDTKAVPTWPSFLASHKRYEDTFVTGLKDMLAHSDELGVFILVLANATYDAALFNLFKQELRLKFNFFADQFNSSDDVNELGAPDDVAVFKEALSNRQLFFTG